MTSQESKRPNAIWTVSGLVISAIGLLYFVVGSMYLTTTYGLSYPLLSVLALSVPPIVTLAFLLSWLVAPVSIARLLDRLILPRFLTRSVWRALAPFIVYPLLTLPGAHAFDSSYGVYHLPQSGLQFLLDPRWIGKGVSLFAVGEAWVILTFGIFGVWKARGAKVGDSSGK